MNETARLILIVLLASFAVERIMAAVDFVWNLETVKPEETKQKLVHFLLGGLISVAVVGFTSIRILKLKFEAPNPVIDFVLTWLVMVGGADKLGQLLETGVATDGAARSAQTVPPIPITVDLPEEEYRVGDNPAETFASLVKQVVNQ